MCFNFLPNGIPYRTVTNASFKKAQIIIPNASNASLGEVLGPLSSTYMRMHAHVRAYVCVCAHVCVRARTCMFVCKCVCV